jgi:basic membrane protein A and related proteins
MRFSLAFLFTTLLISLGMMSIAQPFVVGINFDQGDWSDPGFNKDVWEGVNAATRDLSESTIETLLFQHRIDANGKLTALPEDIDLIIAAGSAQLPFVQAAASSLPNTHILLIDAAIEAPNVNSILFKEYEISYVLGYLAGTMTQTGTVGFIGEMPDQKALATAGSYNQGVVAACAECRVLSDYVGEANQPEKATALASAQQLNDADIFFAPAGGSSTGVIDFINKTMCFVPTTLRPSPLTAQLSSVSTSLQYTANCQNAVPLFFIGDNNNQPHVGDIDNDPTTLNHALSAIHKRVDRLAYQALVDSVNGRSVFGTRIVGLADGAIDYALNDYNKALISQDIIDKLESVKAQILSGEIILSLPAVTPASQ